MFESSKTEKKIEELRFEIASLRAALETERARSASLELALQEAREAIAPLNATHQNAVVQLRRVEDRLGELEKAFESVTTETGRHLEEIERRVPDPNRLLRMETRMDQQAEDVQTAIAGLVMRIDALTGPSKSS